MTEQEAITEIIMSKMKEECIEVNIDFEQRKVVCLDDIGLIIRDTLEELDKEIQQYRALGTSEELREAREKQVSKKLEVGNDNGNPRKCCARCGCFVHPASRYCSKCGQAIDWSNK